MLKLRINGVQAILSTYRCSSNTNWVSYYTTTAAAVTSNTDTMVGYLVTSLGFSQQEALTTCTKVCRFKSAENPNSVIHFFKTSGFHDTQIKDIVANTPKILSCKVDKTLKPKFDALKELGFSQSDVIHLVCANPEVVFRSLNAHIVPTLETLRVVLGDGCSDSVFFHKVLKKSAWLLGPSAKKEVPLVVSLLRSYGLSVDQIKLFALRKTRYLTLGTKLLQPVLSKVEDWLGIPRESGMFFHGIVAMCSVSDENLEVRMGIYKSYGWSEEDVLALARKNPYVLMVSEKKLRKVLDFFMKEVGYQPADLAVAPYVLTLSLEARVIPRYEVLKALKEKELLRSDYSLITCLNHQEPRFFRKFVLPYRDEHVELYDAYVSRVGTPLKAAKYPLKAAK